ncbi:DcuS/MalK family sensor histidine kinase [Oceanobacillus kapialis]|uniref:histidine kinase n=2 Tax=Bacillati TaxID=1783272 RepID=A0ABW5PW20_9BACI
MKKFMKLNTMIVLFVCIVVLSSLLITDLLISRSTSERIEQERQEKAQTISRTVADSPIVVEGLSNEERAGDIQEYTNEVQNLTEVMYVVVMDMNGIRKSHPNPDRIGESFVGGDEDRVLNGEESISISEGTLGDSLRAFTPVFATDGEQIGAVAVGISLESIALTLSESHRNILIGTIFGLLVGVIGAIILARYIKGKLFGLEPEAISQLLEERSTMLQSVHEGIVAVDKHSTITLVNKSALRIFKKAGLTEEPIGMNIKDYMYSSKLERVLQTGESEHDEEQSINGVTILVNREPLVVNQEIVGAISTFRDMTEVNQLAKQLTGIRTYAEALRAQSHEFMNRLHVIFGMVQMEAYDELLEFIRKLVDNKNHDVEKVAKNIKDPVLAGLLMGKLSYAREEGVDLQVICESTISESPNSDMNHELITIMGNLIDNAIEALSHSDEKKVKVRLKEEEHKLFITLADSGPGIKEENLDAIFTKGFSTKGPNRGVGLYLVKQSVEKLNGELNINTSSEGSTFDINVQLNQEEGIIDD